MRRPLATRGAVRALCQAGIAAVLVALSVAPRLAGQEAPACAAGAGVRLTLADALARALECNPDLQVASRQLDASEGRLEAARSVYDPQVGSDVLRSRTLQPLLAPDGSVASPLRTQTTTYDLTLTKQLPGILLQPSLTLASTEQRPLPVPLNSASASLALLVPLAKDRLGRLTDADARSASALYGADQAGVRSTAASSGIAVIVAYWAYAAAGRGLGVYVSSEARAARLVTETEQLVAADERPASDLNQVRANLAAKRLARIAAEQAVVNARKQLGLLMGVDAESILRLPPASDSFPAPQAFAATPALRDRFVRLALERRAELTAQREQERSADVLAEAAANDLRPRMDLALSLGYLGIAGQSGVQGFLTPLNHNVPGASFSAGLQYRFPLRNALARGTALERSAVLEQLRIRGAQLTRSITAAVNVAVDALARGTLSVQEAGQAVELYSATVDAEKQKNQLGAGTLFDVILAEDNLTTARLNEVNARAAYAGALAQLRYETGLLVEIVAGRPAIDAARSISVP